MSAVVGNMFVILWWWAMALIVLGFFLLVPWLAEKWCLARMIAAHGQVSYEFWYDWDRRCEDAKIWLLGRLALAVALFALVTTIFFVLTTWSPPVWE